MGEVSPVLKAEVAQLNELGCNVRWFYSEDGSEAVAVGYGFVWVVAEYQGQVARYQADLGELRNGIKQAAVTR